MTKQILLLTALLFVFSDLFAQVINTFPYNYAFENESQGSTSCGGVYSMSEPGWFNDLSDDIDWTSDRGGTPSSGTGPIIDFAPGTSTGYYMYTETSGCYGDVAYLETPYFDFTALNLPQIDFWYHMQGSAMGTMSLDAKIGANGTWTQILAPFTDNLNAWQQQVVTLAAFGNTDSVKIRFAAITGTSFTSDMAIDNVTVGTAPSCPQPNSLNATNVQATTADLSWTESGTATLWQIEYGLQGFSQGSGNTILANTNNLFGLTGLTPNSDYGYYVRSLCSGHPLIISGVYDGPNSGGTPKGVELYAIADIPDLSAYGISSANNGGGATGSPEFTFPAVSVSAGTYLYISSESTQFTNFFGFAPDYTSSSMLINGDDAVELFYGNTVIDVFGDVNVDGTGQAWEYLDGWATRVSGQTNNNGTFTLSNWTFSGINQLEGGSTNATCTSPFPLATFTTTTDNSPWNGPFAFTTACAATVAPWLEDVETMPLGNLIDQNCWTETGGTFSWYTDNNGTPSSSTGPNAAYSGSKYFYTEASSGSSGNIAELTSPVLDISALSTPILSFYYHMYGATVNRMDIDVYDGSSWINSVDAIIGQQQAASTDPWQIKVVNLSAYAGIPNLQIRFRVTRGTSFTGDVAIDDIEVKDAPNVSMDALLGLQSNYCNAPIAVDMVITNNSSNAEADVPWFIESNGAIINSGSIALLDPNSSDTIPVVLAIYPSNPNAAITAYTALASDFTPSDDTITSNLQVSYSSLNATMTSAVGCQGDSTGVILAEGTGGLGQYTYSWSSNAGAPAGNTANGLSAGTYSVSATDTTGCTAVATLILQDPPSALSSNDSVSNVSCNGGNDATISTIVQGGVPGYVYAWNNGSNNAVLSNITAGNYSLTITDAYGCSILSNYTVTEPASALNVSINDNANGTLTAVASGGTVSYSYLWSSLAGSQTTSTATGLNSGTYTVLVTDANGCTQFSTIDIIVVSNDLIPDNVLSFKLAPNPSAGNTVLSINQVLSQQFDVSITDISGKIIERRGFNVVNNKEIVLPTSTLPAGLYFVNIHLPHQIISKKLILLD